MNFLRSVFFSASAALAMLSAGCSDDAAQPAAPPAEGPLSQTIDALGGADALRAIEHQKLVVTGDAFDPDQAFAPGSAPLSVGGFSYESSLAADFSLLHVNWTRDSSGFSDFPRNYEEILNGSEGYVGGNDSLTPAVKGAMLSSRIAAVRKQQRLLNPHLLVRYAAEHPDIVKEPAEPSADIDGRPHRVVELADAIYPISLYIDAETGLITKLSTREADPLRGDALLEVRFSEWTQTGAGALVPQTAAIALDGAVIHAEQRTSVEANPALSDSEFAVKESLPLDESEHHRGEARAHWFHRFLSLGFNVDVNQAASVMLNTIADGVIYVTGGTYHSLAIELTDSIVVVEAPLDDARSRAVIAALKKQWPGKPISHIINTHHHHDHSGGLRTYAAEGATMVISAKNEAHFKAVLAAPHTIEPDALAESPIDLVFLPVSDAPFDISDGARTVSVVPLATSHADGNLVVYLPELKLIFTSDLYSPGVFPPNIMIPDQFKPFRDWAQELYNGILASGLDVQQLAGGHGLGLGTIDGLKTNSGL